MKVITGKLRTLGTDVAIDYIKRQLKKMFGLEVKKEFEMTQMSTIINNKIFDQQGLGC
jgi:hypothetical protein